MAGKVGFEPTTLALTVRCSAIELYAKKWSERWDLNPQSSAPKADAIAKLRYARIKLYIKSSELEYNLTISLKKLLKNYIIYIYRKLVPSAIQVLQSFPEDKYTCIRYTLKPPKKMQPFKYLIAQFLSNMELYLSRRM